MPTRFLIAAGLLIVLWQLSHIAVSFPVASYQYGMVGDQVEKITRTFVRYTEIAKRAVRMTPEYESVVFVGDVLLARNVEVLMRRETPDYPFAGLSLHSLGARPAIVGNFESSMAEPHVMTPALQMRFSVDEALLGGLVSARFTHLSLANNHSFDYGEEAYARAETKLTDAGFDTFGHGEEVNNDSVTYIKTKRGLIALIGIHASAREPDYQTVRKLFSEASEKSFMQVVYIHWGAEYKLVHNLTQERIAKELIAAGADLIVGHHPHVVQDVDLIDDVVVFYSLGNYVFDQYFSHDVKEGMVVTLDVNEDPVLNLLPVTSEYSLSQPSMMKPYEHQSFLEALAKRSDPKLTQAILEGVIPLQAVVATSTEMAIMMR
ncbi:MAG TPA: CapA family protein [Candidatus Paceibacterota bacterium]